MSKARSKDMRIKRIFTHVASLQMTFLMAGFAITA